mmetsp:Transcript_67347/g.170872  ORF Transcript_67347/g.170872 Transcript_67347/m.170872 type:complete len:200 (+) Transcript_67347:375-974(+)
MASGNLMFKIKNKVPRTKGLLYVGMPSSGSAFRPVPSANGWMTSPGFVFAMNCRPSRCVISLLKPVSASRRSISRVRKRSAPCLRKSECSCWCTTTTKSPVSQSGCSSALPTKTSFCPCCIPFSTKTSRTSRNFFVLTTVPTPAHTGHGPGRGCNAGPWRITCPEPRHSAQGPVSGAAVPSSPLSSTSRLMASFRVQPV